MILDHAAGIGDLPEVRMICIDFLYPPLFAYGTQILIYPPARLDYVSSVLLWYNNISLPK